MKTINVLSLFDGKSCGQVALNKVGVSYDKYYASEICVPSIKVTQERFPNTIQVGDVRSLSANDFKGITLLQAGSPCQGFSMCGKRKGMVTTENVKVDSYEKYTKLKNEGFQFEGQSYLFWEFIRLMKEINPKYFFLENVKMNKDWENIITKTMGVEPIAINSSLVSAQNRLRYYWTNIPNFKPITDKNIMFNDVIPGAISAGNRGRKFKGDSFYTQVTTKRKDGKGNCVVCTPHMTNRYFDKDGNYNVITPEHAEVLQTLPIGYTDIKGISKSDRHKMIGNGWTIDVITEFYKNLM